MVENELISWATDNIVNLLVIAGVIAGGLKAVDHHYQNKLDEEVATLKEWHDNDLKAIKESVKDKVEDLYRNIDRLETLIMSLILPGTNSNQSRYEKRKPHNSDI